MITSPLREVPRKYGPNAPPAKFPDFHLGNSMHKMLPCPSRFLVSLTHAHQN
jgi:hypothetical protein